MYQRSCVHGSSSPDRARGTSLPSLPNAASGDIAHGGRCHHQQRRLRRNPAGAVGRPAVGDPPISVPMAQTSLEPAPRRREVGPNAPGHRARRRQQWASRGRHLRRSSKLVADRRLERRTP
jgi:hypothetical protein